MLKLTNCYYQHQRHITMKHNLPSCLDTSQLFKDDNELEKELAITEDSFFDIINYDVQQKNTVDHFFHWSNEEVSVKYHHPMINRYGNDCIPIGL